eukprot:15442694-Alexandrium_andersonii.AAC.1
MDLDAVCSRMRIAIKYAHVCWPGSLNTETDMCYRLFCMEVFAGSARLTEALNKNNGVLCAPFDLKMSPTHDILDPDMQNFIKRIADTGMLDYVHMAIPCETHSIARLALWQSSCNPMHTHEQVCINTQALPGDVYTLSKDVQLPTH